MWIYRKDKHSWVKYWYTFSTGICNSASFKLHIKEHNLSEKWYMSNLEWQSPRIMELWTVQECYLWTILHMTNISSCYIQGFPK